MPVVAVYGTLVWLAAGLISQNHWISFVLLAFSTYFMVEINNRNALLRVRSRMVSSAFVMLQLMGVTTLLDWKATAVVLCMVIFLFLMFTTCQVPDSAQTVFSAFVFIGIASMFWVQVLYLVPLMIILMARPLYALTIRTLSASLLGLLLPYWLGSTYLLYIQEYQPALLHLSQLADFSCLFDYSKVTLGMVLNYVVLVVSFIVGMVHFIANTYKDKIRVRLLFRTLMVLSGVIVAVIAVTPQYYGYLMPVLVTAVSPLVAHLFTFTNTRVSNYCFLVWILLVITLTVFSLCLTSSYNMVLSECL